MQVSSSKKWSSEPAIDEAGKPILNKEGKPVLRKSYSVLQDDYFNHMRDAGYDNVKRGEKGSSEEHLTVTQFKVMKEEERLKNLVEKENEVKTSVRKAEEKLSEVTHTIEDIRTFTMKYEAPLEELLPEPSTFETARNYRDKKAIPLFMKILEDMRSLKRAHHELWRKAIKIKDSYDYVVRTNDALMRKNKELVQENELIKEKAEAFDYVLKALGAEKVRDIIARVKAREKEKECERAWKRKQNAR